MSVTSAGSAWHVVPASTTAVCCRAPPVPPPPASLRELPEHAGRASPACLAVKLGTQRRRRERERDWREEAWRAPVCHRVRLRALGVSPWLLCCVCLPEYPCPAFTGFLASVRSLSLAQMHQLCPSPGAQPQARLAFASEFPHVPTCPEDTHSCLASSQGKIRAGSDSANQHTLGHYFGHCLHLLQRKQEAFFAAAPQHGTAEIACFSGLCWSDGRRWPRFHILFHYDLSQCVEYRSLCCPVGPC